MVLTPAQLRRKASNKATAHRLRASHQLLQAATAATVAAALGSGEEVPGDMVSAAAREVAALQLTYRTRTTTDAIKGQNPLTRPTSASSTSESVLRSWREPIPSSVRASEGFVSSAPVTDEAVFWIYENLKFRLHHRPKLHSALVAIAVRARDRLGQCTRTLCLCRITA